MSCAEFFVRTGWHCAEVKSGNSSATYISTPITLPGGKPADFYLQEIGSMLRFSDDGLTIFALRAAGFDLTDRRNWKGIEGLATGMRFELHENGEIYAEFPYTDLPVWGERILRLFASIAGWAADRDAERDTDFSLTNEIERILREKAPDVQLEKHVPVKLGRAEAYFDFRWGDTYIDAVRPVALSVNAKLRKALLVSQHHEEEINVLFIIDNRTDPEKADSELGLLGSMAPAIRLTDFQKSYSVH